MADTLVLELAEIFANSVLELAEIFANLVVGIFVKSGVSPAVPSVWLSFLNVATLAETLLLEVALTGMVVIFGTLALVRLVIFGILALVRLVSAAKLALLVVATLLGLVVRLVTAATLAQLVATLLGLVVRLVTAAILAQLVTAPIDERPHTWMVFVRVTLVFPAASAVLTTDGVVAVAKVRA